jgi:hypothetical protein
MSKFVLRPQASGRPNDPTAWHDELAGLAEAVADLQT